jgi:hypothetical protein
MSTPMFSLISVKVPKRDKTCYTFVLNENGKYQLDSIFRFVQEKRLGCGTAVEGWTRIPRKDPKYTLVDPIIPSDIMDQLDHTIAKIEHREIKHVNFRLMREAMTKFKIFKGRDIKVEGAILSDGQCTVFENVPGKSGKTVSFQSFEQMLELYVVLKYGNNYRVEYVKDS